MSIRNNTWRTKASNDPKYRKDYQGLRQQKHKTRAVNYLGGCCQRCGVSYECLNVYDFHHVDPSQKEAKIATMMGRNSWEKIKKELDKCMLVCANCHREIHAEERWIESSS